MLFTPEMLVVMGKFDDGNLFCESTFDKYVKGSGMAGKYPTKWPESEKAFLWEIKENIIHFTRYFE